MGKILESIGVIDGFDINTIGKYRAKKDESFSEIQKYDEGILEEVRKLVNTDTGRIFAIMKKGIIYGIYIFEVEKKEEEANLKHIKTVYSDEVQEDTREKYDEYLLSIAKEYVSYQEYNKVTFNDEDIKLDPKKSKTEKTLAMVGGYLIGFVLGWTLFGELYWGLIYGFIFMPIFSGVDVVVQKKRGRKKKK